MPSSNLSVFFRPRGIAVIGASGNPEKLGHGIVRNLRSVHYPGPVYPVNPNEDEILDYKVYPSIADVPDPVELAVIIVPAPAVAAQVDACGQRGLKGAIIISGGFRELGASEGGIGAARERELKRIAEQHGLRLLGPNCMGTIDTHTPLNTTFMFSMPRPGDIAFVSQSGAMVAAVMDWAAGSGVGFSRIVSLGNQADVTSAEMLGPGGIDERTRVVTGYMEGVEDGRAFVEAAARVARDRPVVFLKAGRGMSGARAVASHTGALAGDNVAYQAAFRRAGVLWANTMEELLDWGRALAWQPLPRGNRVAILTSAGGPAILAADALEVAGMRLAPLTAETKAFLRARVFPHASIDNPVDVLAGVGPATYAVCLDALLADETVDAVVVVQAPQDWFKPASLAEVVGEAANSRLGRRKPVLTVIMGEASNSEAIQILHRRRIPNYVFPERVGSTLAAMWWRKQWLDQNVDDGRQTADDRRQTIDDRLQAANDGRRPADYEAGGALLPAEVDRAAAEAAIRATRDAGRAWMGLPEVEALLRAYGIGAPRGGLASEVEEALALAESIGYPVALKIEAAGITHKTDVGGVVLNIQTSAQLRAEFAAMLERVGDQGPGIRDQGSGISGETSTLSPQSSVLSPENATRSTQHATRNTIRGVSVQRMVAGAVRAELIVGLTRDPQFGPLLMVGRGGTEVELARDVAFELAPLTPRQVEDALDRTAAGRLLAGFRGAPPADRAAAIAAILRLAQLALDWAAIQEIEINPLLVLASGEGAVAVDARVRVAL